MPCIGAGAAVVQPLAVPVPNGTILPRERLGVAGQGVAAAEGALDITVEYVLERKAFGQTIASFQNTRFKLAEVKTPLAPRYKYPGWDGVSSFQQSLQLFLREE